MIRRLALAAALVAAGLSHGSALAQQNMGNSNSGPYANPAGVGTPQPDAGRQRRDWDKVYQAQPQQGKPAAQEQQVLHEVDALTKSINLSCSPTDAMPVAQGPAVVNGQTVQTKTYEVSCSNGMGYYLTSQAPVPPSGFSCFAAEAARAADVAHGRAATPICSLPENSDTKAMASAVLGRLGETCQATGVRWIGQSLKTHTEYTEIACSDGKGYVLASATVGSAAAPTAQSCADSQKRGIDCKLTNSGPPPLTIQTFKDALAQHNISCEATNVRVIGQETVQKRHVVEFECPQHPKGLVAFIPLDGDTAPFEAMDCAAAAKLHVMCKLAN
jgi:hypothetical protein